MLQTQMWKQIQMQLQIQIQVHSDLYMCIKIRSMPLFLLYLVHSRLKYDVIAAVVDCGLLINEFSESINIPIEIFSIEMQEEVIRAALRTENMLLILLLDS